MSERSKLVVKKYFRLFDYNVYDDGMYATDKTFTIQMFGVNEHGQKLCVYVNDYKPFFYIKVHDDWKSKEMTQWYRSLDERFQKYITNTKLVEHHKLYGFSGGKKHKFIRLEFDNTSAMSQVKNLWFTNDSEGERCRKNMIYKDVELELYESNIPPLLRYFHVNEISPSGWISYKQNRVLKINDADKKTSCDYEISASYKNIIPEPTKETIVPFNICSFDIEASSSHGDFPLPKKTYKRLASNIVDIFMKQRKYSNAELMSPVFRRCIMKAFGYDNIAEDVDVVYPKKSITKDELDKIIQMYVKVPMNKICMETDEATQELLNIQDIFEDVHSQQQQESTSMDSDVHASQEIGDNVQAWKKKLSYKKKIKNNVNIIEYLLEDTHTREEQLNALDILLMSKLPHLEGDKVTFIGSTFLHYGKKEPHKNHCIVLGDCDEVKGVEIVTAKTEREVLLEWTKLIQVENPDIIIGYNIFGFDYEFMFQRSQENDCVSEFLKLSLDKEHISKKETRDSGIQIMNTKVMLASGEYDLRYYNMVGRLQIDMYTYFRRDFNLSSYKLDDVAGQFISDSIKKVECTTDANGKEITKLYSKNLMGLHVDDFIHIELSSFTSDYFKDGKKFRVLDIERDVEVEEKGKMNTYNVIVINEHQDIDKSKNLKWGMAKDDVTPQDIFRLSDEGPKGRAIVAKYCIQDCNLVHHLMNKIDVITGYMEMSNICSVPISFLVFRGQGIKLTSYVAKKCREKDTLMPDLEKPKFASGYEGAIVLPPKCKMYMDNPVACVDYSSLYPSSMISQNYSHDSKVWSKEFDLDGNMLPDKTTGERDEDGTFIYDNVPGYQYIDIEFDTYEYRRASPTSRAEKIKVGSKICRWAQLPDNQKSIMPAILEELLKARKDTRKMIKTEKDPFMQNILDKRQLGYKVTANSLYGQCGARTSTFYEQDVAASTTATGRMMIIYARRMVEEVYGDLEYDTETHGKVRTKAEYVYGDTDSVFFTFNLEDAKTGEKITGQRALEITIEIAQDAADLCTKYLKLPMKLEYEKTLMPFILLSKKRYVGMLYEEDPNKGYLKFMGLSLKRRDSCDYLKDVYGGILNILMREGEGNNLRDAIDYLNKSLLNLIDGKVSMDKLMITKALRSDYKNPQQIGHRVLADRIGERDPGNKPRPGDRMRFVFVVNDKPKALMGDKIETPDYIVENNVQIDYTHYITNQLMKPLQQLFGLAVEDIWTMQKKMSAIKTYRRDVAKLEQDCGGDLELFMKKREKISSAKIKVLLFDKMLETIHNRKHKIQTLDVFFTSKR
uniref:DNA-directed DNA polymerase n=1 Tax=viral metagenome TaxID=1070528 RepID=A0A6C0ISJ2_9ZZZZ